MSRIVLLAVTLCSCFANAQVTDFKITSDRAPDCSSLKSIVETVTRGCKTDEEKVIALYNFQRYVYYHYAYPTEDTGSIGALKMINVYGWGLCGGLHSVQASLWDAAGYKWRYRGWSNPGHTTTEVFFGDRWHYLDTFLKFYCWMPDPRDPSRRTIAGQEDILANPALVTDGFVFDSGRNVAYHKDNRFDYVGDKVNWMAPAFMDCGDDLPGVLLGIKNSNNSGSPRGWASIKFDDPEYSTAVNLGVGYALTLNWDRNDDAWYFKGNKNPPRHTCGDKDQRNCPIVGLLLEPYPYPKGSRSWANGTLVFRPDLNSDAFLGSLKEKQNVAWSKGKLAAEDATKPASIVIEMNSPYVVAKAMGAVTGEGVKAAISLDQKKWVDVDLAKLDAPVGKYRYFVRLTFKSITALELTSTVQHNAQALPFLAPGDNVITISGSAQLPRGARAVVTYAYTTGARDVTFEKLFDQGAEIGKRFKAHWSETPVVVQKVVDQFPCQIEIPVATPKDKQPVYPRMLFVRREVLAPGQDGLSVPTPPIQPKVGPNETLATLPNPWTMGTQAPAGASIAPAAAGKKLSLQATSLSYVSRKGEVFDHHFIKHLKDNSDEWLLLAAFDKSGLPEAKKLQSAKLVVYVNESHDKAPAQAAAFLLDGAFEKGKPFDFGKLGGALGTAVVEKGNGQLFAPAKRYEIDVTRAVRSWIGGQACNGLALRLMPNKSIDEGWTVRITPDKEKPVELEITVAE